VLCFARTRARAMTNAANSNPSQASNPVPQSPSGLLLIDKHQGPTSMQICANVRARLRKAGAPKRIKVGHAGTLDPMATGLLVVMVGKATRLCNQFMASRKQYVTTIDLSRRSDTFDLDGQVTSAQVEASAIPTRERVDEAVAKFVGIIQQTPPAFSAIKIGGQRAYDLAREGKHVELSPRPIEIFAIRVDAYAWPLLTLTIDCGKGTYIRSLARDIGDTLHTGGILTSLRRTISGQFDVQHARQVMQLPERLTQQDLLPMPE
jgi:tRNA pseudouridine55 synthase